MKPVTLTIAIPTFNRARELKQMIQSFAEEYQRLSVRLRLLVSDNCSTDGTAGVIDEIAELLPNVSRFRWPEKMTAADNIDKVVRLSETDYVWVLGDDDRLKDDAISTVLCYADKGYDYIIGNWSVYDSELKICEKPAFESRDRDREITEPDDALASLGEMPGFISCVIARRSILSSIDEPTFCRYRPYGFAHLVSFYTGIRELGAKGVVLQKCLLDYRSGNSGGYSWAFYFIEGLPRIFDDLWRDVGYSYSARTSARRIILKRLILPHIASRRAQHADAAEPARLARKTFSGELSAVFLIFVVQLAPPLLMRAVRELRRGRWRRQAQQARVSTLVAH